MCGGMQHSSGWWAQANASFPLVEACCVRKYEGHPGHYTQQFPRTANLFNASEIKLLSAKVKSKHAQATTNARIKIYESPVPVFRYKGRPTACGLRSACKPVASLACVEACPCMCRGLPRTCGHLTSRRLLVHARVHPHANCPRGGMAGPAVAAVRYLKKHSLMETGFMAVHWRSEKQVIIRTSPRPGHDLHVLPEWAVGREAAPCLGAAAAAWPSAWR